MDISELLDSRYIFFDLPSDTREQALRAMVDGIAVHDAIPDPANALNLLLDRERVLSTGIGGGVAIPHAFLPGLDRSILAIGLAREGVDFRSLDNKAVNTIFLLLGAASAQGRHLRVLARLSRILSSTEFVRSLHRLETPESVVDHIRAEEERLRFDRPR